MPKSRPISKEDFFLDVSPEPNSGCWLWMLHLDKKGYGKIQRSCFKPIFGGINLLAHRYSYFLHYGIVPPADMKVCHKCDVTSCVNPDHLFLATQYENVQDCIRKGRWTNTKLTDDQVNYIRSSTETYRELAERYGVSRSLINMIRLGRKRTKCHQIAS